METLTNSLLDACVQLARNAGALVMQVYRSDFAVQAKADASPVTEADQRAEALLLRGLRQLTPGVPIVAEEEAAAGHAPPAPGDEFWLVDPLDGTREFVARNGEFTVNVALVQRGVPVLGVVYAPAIERLFAGAHGLGSFEETAAGRQPVAARTPPAAGLTVLGSRSHGDAAAMADFLRAYRVHGFKSAGSSLKFCLLAAGEADLYPRLGRTMEWDTAAGDAVLRAAGGAVCTLDGAALRYGKPGFENPHFVARGRAQP